MKYNIEELRKINDYKIKELQEQSNKKNIQTELALQLAIKEVLAEDDCFFKLKMDTAIDILTKLIEKDNIKESYLELISSKNYKKTS